MFIATTYLRLGDIPNSITHYNYLFDYLIGLLEKKTYLAYDYSHFDLNYLGRVLLSYKRSFPDTYMDKERHFYYAVSLLKKYRNMENLDKLLLCLAEIEYKKGNEILSREFAAEGECISKFLNQDFVA